jgi:AraC-like DNA-binding protein
MSLDEHPPYRERPAPAPLRAHFQCLWSSQVAGDYAGGFLVVPDGCVDIVFKNGRLWVAGPDRVATQPDLVPGSQVLGARFAAGAARAWLGLPMDEIVGQAVELGDLIGAQARPWARRIEDAQGVERQALWSQALLALGAGAGAVDVRAALAFDLARQPGQEPGRALAAMRARLDLSERSLRRLCHAQFGYGPKTLERILRFQQVLSLARADPCLSLASLALEAGYADQAHLSRELRALCGMGASSALDRLCG